MKVSKMKAIKKTKVQPYRARLICGCGGELVFTGEVCEKSHPHFYHRCNKCGVEESLHKKFPRIEYDDEDEHLTDGIYSAEGGK